MYCLKLSGAELRFDNRQLDVRAGVDSYFGRPVVGWRCRHDAWHKRLRIPIVKREPGALHLHHDAMALQENMIGAMEAVAEFFGCVFRNGLGMLVAGR